MKFLLLVLPLFSFLAAGAAIDQTESLDQVTDVSPLEGREEVCSPHPQHDVVTNTHTYQVSSNACSPQGEMCRGLGRHPPFCGSLVCRYHIWGFKNSGYLFFFD